MLPNGSDITRLTPWLPDGYYDAAWSPDGELIAFIQDGDLSVMNHDGSHRQRLLDRVTSFDWSPDAKRIVYDRDRTIGIIDLQSRTTRTLAIGSGPTWSPDGALIAYSSYTYQASRVPLGFPDLFAIRVDGSNPSRLTADPASSDYAPVWSPDGRSLLFERYPEYDQSEWYYTADIWQVSHDGSEERQVTRWRDQYNGAGAPVWSPDGTSIAFQTCWDEGGEAWVMDASDMFNGDGDGGTQLTHSGRWTQAPHWLPWSDRLIFSVRRRGDELWTIDPDGTDPEVVLTSGTRLRNGSPYGHALALLDVAVCL